MFTFPWSLSNILPSCILLFWNIFSSDFADPSLPPERLNLRIEGEAKKHVGDTAGWYFRQNRFCHRYPYWRIDSNKIQNPFEVLDHEICMRFYLTKRSSAQQVSFSLFEWL